MSVGEETTIVGVATGTPDGGVAIVRLSGSEAPAIAARCVGELPPPRVLARRRFRERPEAAPEDLLAVYMPGPRSFTGEDVVELHVHAGARNVRAIVEALLAAGAVAAGPGDFTRRAFENGRLTLDQAEGIAALIGARTQAAVEQARRLVVGELGREVEALRVAVGDLRGEVEANLDFPEDVADGDVARWISELDGIIATVRQWLGRFAAGRRSRERTRVVLAGPPNAGKSALFNALLGKSRAIVSPTPGTTRDYVEAELQIGQAELVLVDTAGLRGTHDEIEEQGVERSREQISGGDLVVWVEAADSSAADESPPADAPVLRVENKRDLGRARPDWLGVSATDGAGLEALREAIARLSSQGADAPWIGLARHRDRADAAAVSLVAAREGLEREVPLEIVAFQLGVAERELGEICGRSTLGPIGEDVLARIFSRFCIGK